MSWKVGRFVRHDFPLVKSFWLLPVTSLLARYLNITSSRICSVTLPGKEMKLTWSVVPWVFCFPFLKNEGYILLFPIIREFTCLPRFFRNYG